MRHNGRSTIPPTQLNPELANPMHFMHGEICCGICAHREAFPPGSGQAALQRITAHVMEHLHIAVGMPVDTRAGTP